MKKLVTLALTLAAALCLAGCSGADADSPAQATTTTFHELSLQLPDAWAELDTGSTDSVRESRGYHEEAEGAWGILDGGAMAYWISYEDMMNNLDVGLSEFQGDEVRELERNLQAMMKAWDARQMGMFTSQTFGGDAADKDFTFGQTGDGSAWRWEGKIGSRASCIFSAPYDDHAIVLLVVGKSGAFDDMERALIESVGFTAQEDTLLAQKAADMVGLTESEVTAAVKEAGTQRIKVDSDSASSSQAQTSSSGAQEAAADAETMSLIAGTWKTKGIWFDLKDGIQSLSDNKNLKDQYGRYALTFNEDGTFQYQKRDSVETGAWTFVDKTEDQWRFLLKATSGGDGIYYAYLQEVSNGRMLVVHTQGNAETDAKPVMSKESGSSPAASSSGKASSSTRGTSSSSAADDDFELVGSGYDDANGKGYKGSDGNYYFKNDDGTVEATDGKGNGVKDVDGDGEPDYYTTDSGKTWHRVP